MRNPNGFGSVYKLSGKRRKPWAVRKTTGWLLTEDGKSYPKYEFLGYYERRSDAVDALRKANSTFAITNYNATVGELYAAWSAEHFEKVSKGRKVGIISSWKKMQPLFSNLKIKDLRLQQINSLLHKISPASQCWTSKITLDLIYDYAIKSEILSPEAKKIMEYVDISDVKVDDADKVKRRIYTKSEITKLWQLADDMNAKILLVLLYTGMRCGEMHSLLLDDIHLKERYIDIRSAKTKAGIRQVPICEKIVDLLKGIMSVSKSDKLLDGAKTTVFYDHVLSFLKSHSMLHTTHDTRHTFVSRMVEAGVDSRVLKQIVGHASANVTDSVYTHISLASKLEAVNKLE